MKLQLTQREISTRSGACWRPDCPRTDSALVLATTEETVLLPRSNPEQKLHAESCAPARDVALQEFAQVSARFASQMIYSRFCLVNFIMSHGFDFPMPSYLQERELRQLP